LRGGLERDACAGGVLVEQVDDGLTAQCGQLGNLAPRDLRHIFGEVEDLDRLGTAEVAGREQVPHAAPPPSSVVTASSIVTASSPSISVRRTLMRSAVDEGRFFPTKSARIGS